MFFEIMQYLYCYIYNKEYSLLLSTSKTTRARIKQEISFNDKIYLELSSYKRFIRNSGSLTWSCIEQVGINCAIEFRLPHRKPHFVVAHGIKNTRLYEMYFGLGLGRAAVLGERILMSRVFHNLNKFGRVQCEETLTLQKTCAAERHPKRKIVQISFAFDPLTDKITATAMYYSYCKVRRNVSRGHFACHTFVGTDVVQLVQVIRQQETTPIDILVCLFAKTSVCWYH